LIVNIFLAPNFFHRIFGYFMLISRLGNKMQNFDAADAWNAGKQAQAAGRWARQNEARVPEERERGEGGVLLWITYYYKGFAPLPGPRNGLDGR
jgi:hypothetical protein